jgi:hypothetical protein
VFSTTTTDADPGDGKIRFNNGTMSSVTELYIDNLDAEANSMTNWLDSLDDSTTSANRGLLHIKPAGFNNYILFQVNGTVTNMTGYRKVPVAYVAGTIPGNDDTMYLWFSRTGNVGAAGSGAGDMVKSVYDPNDDGKVVAAASADSVPWTGVTSKPSTFPPEAHGHSINDVTNLQTTLDGKAASSHGHVISDVTGLQTALDGKASSSHGHAISDVTGLQTALDGKQAANAVLTELTALTDPNATRLAYWNDATNNFENHVSSTDDGRRTTDDATTAIMYDKG